jgi:hypothetical protein
MTTLSSSSQASPTGSGTRSSPRRAAARLASFIRLVSQCSSASLIWLLRPSYLTLINF